MRRALRDSRARAGPDVTARGAAPLRCALAALLAVAPALAVAAVSVSSTTIQAPSGAVAAGSTLTVLCKAEGNSTSTSSITGQSTTIDRIDVTVSGGTVAPSELTGAIPRTCTSGSGTCSYLQGIASWTTPATPATLTATCTISFTTTSALGDATSGTVSSSASVTTVSSAELPPVVSPVSGPGQVLAGDAVAYSVTASDPSAVPQPLGYAWRATGGAVTADSSNPAAAIWVAPAAPGSYDVTVTVTRGAYAVEATRNVTVLVAEYQAGLPVGLRTPSRVVAAEDGKVYVVDPGPRASGKIALLTARGEAMGFATLPESPLAVASGAGFLWVTTITGKLLKIDPASAAVVATVPLSDGKLSVPAGIAYDPTRMQLWIADAGESRVRIVTLDGVTVRVLSTIAGFPIREPIDVALDPAANRAWVLSGEAKKTVSLATGEPVVLTRFLHAFDLDGHYAASYGSRDTELARAGGLAVGAGRVYVSDPFQGTVVAFDAFGRKVSTIGAFGAQAGQLKNPTGLAVLANGDLAVANTTVGRVDRFGIGAPLPTCAGDSDCDGLPDDWEVAHGLNPSWAGDALLDLDADGATNLQELALGTDPARRDTDGDGWADGDEMRAGFDPLDPNDHKARLLAHGPPTSPPGLVRLSAVASGNGACSVTWRQAAGPAAVALRSSSGGADASFVARSVGAYDLEARAQCGAEQSDPTTVRVEIANVPPLADAGRVLVAAPGAPLRLDAAASTDANGGALTFSWDQLLGPPLAPTTSGAALVMRPRGPGYYVFQVTATDGQGASAISAVPVLVPEGPVPTAIAASYPGVPSVGGLVSLDASASLVSAGDPPSYAWSQVFGPQVVLDGADQPVAAFVPQAAGRYAFEVSVAAGVVRAPPARVEVFVAGTKGLPEVAATASASVVAVDSSATLEATGTGSGLTFQWAQVAGPAAGLTDAGAAVATVVPFSPGFHVFEVTASDGEAVSRPARVAFEARAGGKAIPVASAASPGLAPVVGQLVFLDGRRSTGAVRYRWTQVEGPWVVLSGQSAVTTFRAPAAGRYAFELEVDDGAIRSAPVRVEVDVAEEVSP